MFYPFLKTRTSHADKKQSEQSVYKRLIDEDEFSPDGLRSLQLHSCYWKLKYQLSALFITFTVVVLIFAWWNKVQSVPQAGCKKIEQPWANCGSSPEDARANKCHYEPMLGAWIPHECFLDEPKDNYRPFEDRIWYRDANLTQPIGVDSLRAGNEAEIWTPFFHEEHCLFGWRRLAAAVKQRVPLIDSFSHNLAHSTHCAKYLNGLIVAVENNTISTLLVEDPNIYVTRVRLEYAKCLPLIDYYDCQM